MKDQAQPSVSASTAATTHAPRASRQILCRDGGFLVSLYENGTAVCPACWWVDESPEDVAHGADGENTAKVRPHKPRPVLIDVREASGWRHYLDEKPMHCGDSLELRWWTGIECRWLPARYEATLNDYRPTAYLYITLPGPDGQEVSTKLTYTRELAIRRPPEKHQADQIRRYVDKLACPSCGSRRNPCTCGPREVARA